MKIRSDFVTNSSSSSFILGFKDRDSVASTLQENDFMSRAEEFRVLLKILSPDTDDKEEILARCKEDYDFQMREIFTRMVERHCLSADELETKVQENVDMCMRYIQEEIDQCGHVVMFEVYDETDPDLEYGICPRLNCTIDHINHHF